MSHALYLPLRKRAGGCWVPGLCDEWWGLSTAPCPATADRAPPSALEGFVDGEGEGAEVGAGAGGRGTGTRKRDVEDAAEPAGARGHHDHAVREEHRLRDRVGDEHDGLALLPAPLAPHAQQLEIHLVAGHRVERAEGLVHEQQRVDGTGRGGVRHPYHVETDQVAHARGQRADLGSSTLVRNSLV